MADAPFRPDPDALLALAAKEGRGRLKVFLGAAPGVGKTFEMLSEGRRLHAGGTEVVVGLVETHGRADTAAQLGTLAVLPRRSVAYRGQVLEEFDLDAALARRPAVLLLDELAHSNAPGSRHPKRWQDAEELRAAGIEVWATMNVQHLESLSEDVARITGIRVQETVPDHVLAGADAVELIDIPPAELLERLRQGKVYRPDQAARALKGFFREGNLAALRQIALRRTADRVDADVTGYMRANAIAGPWPAGDRVLALVGRDATAEEVVRQARRIADVLRAPLLALHVETLGAAGGSDPAPALRLAERLGASVETTVARDLPAAVLAHARAQNATHLVIGRGRPPFWRRLLGRRLTTALIRQAEGFTLHLIPAPSAVTARLRREAPGLGGLGRRAGAGRADHCAVSGGRWRGAGRWARHDLTGRRGGAGGLLRAGGGRGRGLAVLSGLGLPVSAAALHLCLVGHPGGHGRGDLFLRRAAAGGHHRRARPLRQHGARAAFRDAAPGGTVPPAGRRRLHGGAADRGGAGGGAADRPPGLRAAAPGR
jgi:two-component system sensor histidine kinase KdpD